MSRPRKAASDLHVGKTDRWSSPGVFHYDLFDNENSHVVCPRCGSDKLEIKSTYIYKYRDNKEVGYASIDCECKNCEAKVRVGFNQNRVGGFSIDAGVLSFPGQA